MNKSRMKLIIKNAVKANLVGRKLRDVWQMRGFTKDNAEKAYDKFVASGVTPDFDERCRRSEIIKDMLTEARKYRFGYDEYFMYHFYKMPQNERRTYVSDQERTAYCERMNNMKNMIYFDDKAQTYEMYGKWYKRDLIGVYGSDNTEEALFNEFIKKHPRFIVKPFDGACGVGIRIIDTREEKATNLFNQLLQEYKKGLVAEELIVQSKSLGEAHPKSVNTIRITTIRYDDRVEIIHPFWRTGRGNSCVDNGGSGGIICSVDKNTGIVFAAADEMGIFYDVHPETKFPLVGFKIPRWDEAISLAKELTMVMPDNRYTGWDFALTDSGWVLQEANDRGAFVGFQLPTKRGFRAEIEKIVKELGV